MSLVYLGAAVANRKMLHGSPTIPVAVRVRSMLRFRIGTARRGTAILLVEQKLTIALKISRRLYVMGHGRIVFEGTPAELAANAGVRKEWLEV